MCAWLLVNDGYSACNDEVHVILNMILIYDILINCVRSLVEDIGDLGQKIHSKIILKKVHIQQDPACQVWFYLIF